MLEAVIVAQRTNESIERAIFLANAGQYGMVNSVRRCYGVSRESL